MILGRCSATCWLYACPCHRPLFHGCIQAHSQCAPAGCGTPSASLQQALEGQEYQSAYRPTPASAYFSPAEGPTPGAAPVRWHDNVTALSYDSVSRNRVRTCAQLCHDLRRSANAIKHSNTLTTCIYGCMVAMLLVETMPITASAWHLLGS